MERLASLKVAIVGAGYVGLTTALALAYIGHRVTCVEKDAEKLLLLKSGKSPIYEPGLEKLLRLVEGCVSFTEISKKRFLKLKSSSLLLEPPVEPMAMPIQVSWKKPPVKWAR